MRRHENLHFHRLLPWAILLAILVVPCARAETLADAVRSAYETNPGLLARRASQRALDETYVQARSGWRPTLGAQSVVSDNREDLGQGQGAELLTDATGNLIPVGGGGSYSYSSGSLTLQASQPLYTGGRVRAAVNAAEADVFGGRESLRAAEIQLVQSVVQAYADVEQAYEVVGIRQDNLNVLAREVEQASAKVELGQATQIDLAQARAQQAAARAQLAVAKSQLQISGAAFRSLVGHAPGTLFAEPDFPALPANVDAAFEAAEQESPILGQARYAEQGARHRVTEARAAMLPTATANLSVGYTGAISPLVPDRFDRAVTASVTITQPIYSGGTISSQIRQAVDREDAARLAVEDTRRSVVQSVSQAWSNLDSATEAANSGQEQVKSAALAFEGLREQNRFGTATTLDLLIQQQQFREAQLMLIQAHHDVLVAQANVLAAIGRLEARQIAPSAYSYNSTQDFYKVKRNSFFPTELIPEALDHIIVKGR